MRGLERRAPRDHGDEMDQMAPKRTSTLLRDRVIQRPPPDDAAVVCTYGEC